jgi:hypothetical protein
LQTAIEPVAFEDDLAPPPSRAQIAKPQPTARPAKPQGRQAPKSEPSGSDEDNLEIGEVSRVVNLADISRNLGQTVPRKHTGRAPMLRQTASAPRLNAPDFAAAAAVGVPGLTGPFQRLDTPVPTETKASRRGMVILLVAAGLLLAGIAAVVLIVTSGGNDDVQSGALGRTREIDTSRPEDIVRKIATQASGSGSTSSTQRPGPIRHIQTTGHSTTGPGTEPETLDPSKRSLDGDEVQDMAAKQSEGTTFCYKRAQRGALGIEIADLKRLDVTLTIDKEGTVTDVQLSSHAADSFGACISTRVRGWRFRQSSGTKTFRVTLVFAH